MLKFSHERLYPSAKLAFGTIASSHGELTKQFVMLKFSHERLYPSAKLAFGTIASSHGELTVQFDTRTFLQQSMSMPSRSVSIFRLSMVRLSTPVTRIPKCPPFRSEIGRASTLREFFRPIVLLPTPACSAWNRSEERR